MQVGWFDQLAPLVGHDRLRRRDDLHTTRVAAGEPHRFRADVDPQDVDALAADDDGSVLGPRHGADRTSGTDQVEARRFWLDRWVGPQNIRLGPNFCGCAKCTAERGPIMHMIVCPECGNKRCPRATHHDNACTGSNEPGQEGSRYA